MTNQLVAQAFLSNARVAITLQFHLEHQLLLALFQILVWLVLSNDLKTEEFLIYPSPSLSFWLMIGKIGIFP